MAACCYVDSVLQSTRTSNFSDGEMTFIQHNAFKAFQLKGQYSQNYVPNQKATPTQGSYWEKKEYAFTAHFIFWITSVYRHVR